MNEAETSVSYYFASKTDDISISLFDKDITCMRCRYCDPTGVFGLTGEFSGWFSNDDAPVPINHSPITIGSVAPNWIIQRTGWKY
jgi:hypothetical protein